MTTVLTGAGWVTVTMTALGGLVVVGGPARDLPLLPVRSVATALNELCVVVTDPGRLVQVT